MPTSARARPSCARAFLSSIVCMVAAGLPQPARAEIQAAEVVRGQVLDGRTGQPIERARVATASMSTSTDADGRFSLTLPAADATEVVVSAVGYGVVRRTVAPGAGDAEFRLAQDAVAYEERVEVRPTLFDSDPDTPLAQALQNVELRNLSGVVTDDVLRAVQSLPGVAAGDDFYGTFSVRGSGFQNAGLYVDGVLVSAPFHTIRDLNDAFSLTILNNDVIDGVTFISGGAPARFGDRVGAVLNLDTRDGNRERTTARASLGTTGASVFAEGPLGGSGTSWLLGARKSFLDYVVRAIQDTPSFVIGYTDVHAKLNHRAEAHTLSLFVMHGGSTFEDSTPGLPRNDVAGATSATTLVNARWVWSPSAATSLATALFWSREAGGNRNASAETLFDTASAQLGGRVDLTRSLGRSHVVRAGLLARRLVGRQSEAVFPRFGPATTTSTFDESVWQPGAYVQDGWTSVSGRFALTAGLRTDWLSERQRRQVLPRASGVMRVSDRTRLSLSAGAYAQFPSLDQLYGQAGNADLVAEESTHLTLGLDHRLSSTVRAQVQVYRQTERHRIGQAQLEPRLERGLPLVPTVGTNQNAWSGTSRGVEWLLQRRSPNGVTGWVSYALAQATLTDAETSLTFDSDNDQRHTVNAYLSYRFGDRTNVSAKFRYGSNTPVPGYYDDDGGGFRLSSERNRLRLPAYSRLDVRANRTFAIRRARLTAYAEVQNLLNHSNFRYTGRSLFLPSGRVTFNRDTQFPLLPAAGLTVEW
jgi:Carboxypeptidase regulatory-like domain/TonB-dependent Receptor Plug Domain